MRPTLQLPTLLCRPLNESHYVTASRDQQLKLTKIFRHFILLFFACSASSFSTELIECETIEAASHVTPAGANGRSLRSFAPLNNKRSRVFIGALYHIRAPSKSKANSTRATTRHTTNYNSSSPTLVHVRYTFLPKEIFTTVTRPEHPETANGQNLQRLPVLMMRP